MKLTLSPSSLTTLLILFSCASLVTTSQSHACTAGQLRDAIRAGETACMEAWFESAQITQEVLNARDDDGWTHLHLAAKYGTGKMCRLFLGHTNFTSGSINAATVHGSTALHIAVSENNAEAVEALYANKLFTSFAAYDLNGRTALHLAVLGGYTSTVAALLKQGALAPVTPPSTDDADGNTASIQDYEYDQAESTSACPARDIDPNRGTTKPGYA